MFRDYDTSQGQRYNSEIGTIYDSNKISRNQFSKNYQKPQEIPAVTFTILQMNDMKYSLSVLKYIAPININDDEVFRITSEIDDNTAAGNVPQGGVAQLVTNRSVYKIETVQRFGKAGEMWDSVLQTEKGKYILVKKTKQIVDSLHKRAILRALQKFARITTCDKIYLEQIRRYELKKIVHNYYEDKVAFWDILRRTDNGLNILCSKIDDEQSIFKCESDCIIVPRSVQSYLKHVMPTERHYGIVGNRTGGFKNKTDVKGFVGVVMNNQVFVLETPSTDNTLSTDHMKRRVQIGEHHILGVDTCYPSSPEKYNSRYLDIKVYDPEREEDVVINYMTALKQSPRFSKLGNLDDSFNNTNGSKDFLSKHDQSKRIEYFYELNDCKLTSNSMVDHSLYLSKVFLHSINDVKTIVDANDDYVSVFKNNIKSNYRSTVDSSTNDFEEFYAHYAYHKNEFISKDYKLDLKPSPKTLEIILKSKFRSEINNLYDIDAKKALRSKKAIEKKIHQIWGEKLSHLLDQNPKKIKLTYGDAANITLGQVVRLHNLGFATTDPLHETSRVNQIFSGAGNNTINNSGGAKPKDSLSQKGQEQPGKQIPPEQPIEINVDDFIENETFGESIDAEITDLKMAKEVLETITKEFWEYLKKSKIEMTKYGSEECYDLSSKEDIVAAKNFKVEGKGADKKFKALCQQIFDKYKESTSFSPTIYTAKIELYEDEDEEDDELHIAKLKAVLTGIFTPSNLVANRKLKFGDDEDEDEDEDEIDEEDEEVPEIQTNNLLVGVKTGDQSKNHQSDEINKILESIIKGRRVTETGYDQSSSFNDIIKSRGDRTKLNQMLGKLKSFNFKVYTLTNSDRLSPGILQEINKEEKDNYYEYIARFYLKRKINLKNLSSMYKNNMPIPLEILIAKPHCSYSTYSIVKLKGGGKSMVRVIGNPCFTMQNDAKQQKLFFQYTQTGDMVVVNEGNIYTQHDAVVDSYHRGGSSEFVDVTKLRDSGSEYWNPYDGKYGSYGESIIVGLMPLGMHKKLPLDIDITGTYRFLADKSFITSKQARNNIIDYFPGESIKHYYNYTDPRNFQRLGVAISGSKSGVNTATHLQRTLRYDGNGFNILQTGRAHWPHYLSKPGNSKFRNGKGKPVKIE